MSEILGYILPLALILIGSVIAIVTSRYVPVPSTGQCSSCGYSLRGLKHSTCPECGQDQRQKPGKDRAAKLSALLRNGFVLLILAGTFITANRYVRYQGAEDLLWQSWCFVIGTIPPSLGWLLTILIRRRWDLLKSIVHYYDHAAILILSWVVYDNAWMIWPMYRGGSIANAVLEPMVVGTGSVLTYFIALGFRSKAAYSCWAIILVQSLMVAMIAVLTYGLMPTLPE